MLATVILAAWTDTWLPLILNTLILLIALFLILLILIQKGKGGGLAGAFGGTGGSSAFGSRAGDQFTRITIIVAAIWVLLIMIMVKMVQPTAKEPTPLSWQSKFSPPTQIADGKIRNPAFEIRIPQTSEVSQTSEV